jgi:hypothetical protein
LNGNRYTIIGSQRCISCRPGFFRKDRFAAQSLPKLLGEVRHHRRDKADKGF